MKNERKTHKIEIYKVNFAPSNDSFAIRITIAHKITKASANRPYTRRRIQCQR